MSVAILAFIYLLPSIVATARKHKNTTAIVVLNLFAGWTIVCWVVALVWSCTDNTKKVQA